VAGLQRSPIRGADLCPGRSLSNGRRWGAAKRKKGKKKATEQPQQSRHDPRYTSMIGTPRHQLYIRPRALGGMGAPAQKKINERMEGAKNHKHLQNQPTATTHIRSTLHTHGNAKGDARRAVAAVLCRGRRQQLHTVGGAPAPGPPTVRPSQTVARQAGQGRGGPNNGMYTAPTATPSRGWRAPAHRGRTGVDGGAVWRQGDAQRRTWPCWQQAEKEVGRKE